MREAIAGVVTNSEILSRFEIVRFGEEGHAYIGIVSRREKKIKKKKAWGGRWDGRGLVCSIGGDSFGGP